MYGLILENIATSIKEKFGEEKWQEIKKIAGIKETHFGVRIFGYRYGTQLYPKNSRQTQSTQKGIRLN